MITDNFKNSYLSILDAEENSFKNKVKVMMTNILNEEAGLIEAEVPRKNYLKELEKYLETEFFSDDREISVEIYNMLEREPGDYINKALGEAEKAYYDTGNSEYSFYEFLFQESFDVVDKFLDTQPKMFVNFMERLFYAIRNTRY